MTGAPVVKIIELSFVISRLPVEIWGLVIVYFKLLNNSFESALMHSHSHPNELILQVELTSSRHPNLSGRPVTR